MLVESCVEKADAVGVSTHEADERSVNRTGISQGKQFFDEPLAQRAILQRHRGCCHLTDEDRPKIGTVNAPVLQCEYGVKFASGGLKITGAGVETSGHGVGVCRRADPPTRRLGSHISQFCRLIAGANDFQSLGHAYVADVTLANGLAECGGFGGEPFPGVDVPVE
jgi:hypothetical protein